jgi:acyl carrier protein
LDAALADALARSVGPAAKPVAEADVLTQVLGVFRAVLDLEDVAADDNFFEIGGGDSLSAVEAAVRVEEYMLAAFGCDIASDAMVFIHPTAKGLSREIERIVHGRP